MYVCGVVTGGMLDERTIGWHRHRVTERAREKQLGYGRFGIREVRPKAKRREDVAVGVAEV